MSEKASEALQGRKRSGKKAVTPEEKAGAAKTRAAEKEKAEQMKPELILQFQGADTDLNALAAEAEAEFRAIKKRTAITSLKLYVKPEERMAYYVVNEKHTGSIAF